MFSDTKATIDCNPSKEERSVFETRHRRAKGHQEIGKQRAMTLLASLKPIAL